MKKTGANVPQNHMLAMIPASGHLEDLPHFVDLSMERVVREPST
jgi:hypothetical protein